MGISGFELRGGGEAGIIATPFFSSHIPSSLVVTWGGNVVGGCTRSGMGWGIGPHVVKQA